MSLANDEIWSPVAVSPSETPRVLSSFERMPQFIFYTPVVIWCLMLSLRFRSLTLPTLANTAFPEGGLLAQPKSDILNNMGPLARAVTAPFATFVVDPSLDAALNAKMAVAKLEEVGVSLPIVAKPDVGRNGVGIEKIDDLDELEEYIAGYSNTSQMILQEFSPYVGEAGIFYVRQPGAAHGKITSLTLKFFPSVVGDGKTTLHNLIMADPRAGLLWKAYFPRFKDRLEEVPALGVEIPLVFTGNHRRGAIFCDGAPHVTTAMTNKIEEMSKEIDGFWFGRFDVRYRDLDALKRGEDFTIIELNGAGAEAIHIYDANMTLFGAYRALFKQYLTAFQIGDAIRKRGRKPAPAWRMAKNYLSEVRMLNSHKK